jgi:hypothetical protein
VHTSITFRERRLGWGSGEDRLGGLHSGIKQRVKILAAAAIAGAFVAIGAAATVAVSQKQTGNVVGDPMTVGQTATTTTAAPLAPLTTKAVPVMTATRPSGF